MSRKIMRTFANRESLCYRAHMKNETTRLFIKVGPEFLASLDAFCARAGMTRSGAARAALDEYMAKNVRADWSSMTRERKVQTLRDAGSGQEAIAKVAETLRVPHDTVERFAYRNGLIGPQVSG